MLEGELTFVLSFEIADQILVVALNALLFIGHVDELLRPFADQLFEVENFLFELFLLRDQIDQIFFIFLEQQRERKEKTSVRVKEVPLYSILVDSITGNTLCFLQFVFTGRELRLFEFFQSLFRTLRSRNRL